MREPSLLRSIGGLAGVALAAALVTLAVGYTMTDGPFAFWVGLATGMLLALLGRRLVNATVALALGWILRSFFESGRRSAPKRG